MKKVWLTVGVIIVVLGLAGVFVYKNILASLPATSGIPQFNSSNSARTNSAGAIPGIPFQINGDFMVHVFANGLGVPRDLQFTNDGTLLVSNPVAGEVYALPDINHDGVSDTKKTIISGENHVHGLALYNGKLYIADVDKVVRYNWDEHSLTATKDKVLFSLPQNRDHNNRTIIFGKDGKMYVSVGSTCNVCREGSAQSATILVSDADGNNPQIFASGLRNAPFMQFNPVSGELWSTEMGRDNLGDNIPPDEIDIIRPDANYGWPNCYGNKIADTSFNKSASCGDTSAPIFEIQAHSAPLGLAFITSDQFPSDWKNDLLVALHGSWNRSVPTGYKIVHLKVKGDSIVSSEDFMTGFIPASAKKGGDALGRPADVTFDAQGNLFVSDDKAGNVYIVQKK